MSTKFKTIITTAGAAKLAAATAPGGRKVNITTMAVGDGGGKLPVPDAGQTKLIHEVWRHALNKISQDKRNSNYLIAELIIPPEVGGFWMRELGLYDDTGTLIAVANMAESYKPAVAEGSGRSQTCRMVIIVSSIASVELSIDTTTVMATQDYVDDKLAEHEQSRRHPDATLTAKGFTQLSSATDSASETQAATPKAVKIAMDNANGRLEKSQNGADIPDKALFLSNINAYSKSEVDSKRGMRKYEFSAPANVESGKWYPVVFKRSASVGGELASRVVISTGSYNGDHAMNNCEFNGMVVPGGWSDRGSYAAGYFWTYQKNERSIHSILAGQRDDDVSMVFYVEARAFPVQILAEEGLSVIVPTTDYTVGQSTYKWGATDPETEGTYVRTILDFNNDRGYYCSHPFISNLKGNAETTTKL